MRVITAPTRLRAATVMLLLSVPMCAIEIMLLLKAHWWRLPYFTLSIWLTLSLVVCFVLMFNLLKGSRRAFNVTFFVGMLWCVSSAGFAVMYRQPALGFFTIFLAWYWGGLLYWLQYELERSYFDAQVSWFQGAPKPIPGLMCTIGDKEYRACRLDKEGIFIFDEKSDKKIQYQKKKKISFLLKFKDKTALCEGLPIVEEPQINGLGLQFFGMGVDSRKSLSDFVENLRGEGYV